MKYFEAFAGVGGFSLGINYAYLRSIQQNLSKRPAGNNDLADKPQQWECVGFSEVDKYASAVLKYHYPTTNNYGDITQINWSKVPDFDLLVGGSPCQDLSIAGKRAGLTGERSGLFFEFIRALTEKKPEHFIWENVKGALSSNEGRDFAEVISAFSESGYSLWWQVLNAKDFGVPQNRERIFVVGTRNGSPREILFERGAGEENPVASDPTSIYKQTERLSDAFRIRETNGVSATLKGLGGGMGAKTGLYAVRQPLRFLERNQRNIEGDYAFTVDASQTSGVRVLDTRHDRAYNDVYAKTHSERPQEKVPTLQEAFDPKTIRQAVGMSDGLSEKVVLQLGVHEGDDAAQMDEGGVLGGTSSSEDGIWKENGTVREVPNSETNGDSSHKRELGRQSQGESSRDLPGLPHPLPQEKSEMQGGILSDDKSSFGVLRKAQPTVREMGKPVQDETQSVPPAYRIRRLVPVEAERLMSWPSNWTQYGNFDGEVKEVSDSQRYKMCGNGVVSAVVAEVVKQHFL